MKKIYEGETRVRVRCCGSLHTVLLRETGELCLPDHAGEGVAADVMHQLGLKSRCHEILELWRSAWGWARDHNVNGGWPEKFRDLPQRFRDQIIKSVRERLSARRSKYLFLRPVVRYQELYDKGFRVCGWDNICAGYWRAQIRCRNGLSVSLEEIPDLVRGAVYVDHVCWSWRVVEVDEDEGRFLVTSVLSNVDKNGPSDYPDPKLIDRVRHFTDHAVRMAWKDTGYRKPSRKWVSEAGVGLVVAFAGSASSASGKPAVSTRTSLVSNFAGGRYTRRIRSGRYVDVHLVLPLSWWLRVWKRGLAVVDGHFVMDAQAEEGPRRAIPVLVVVQGRGLNLEAAEARVVDGKLELPKRKKRTGIRPEVGVASRTA